MYISPNKSDDQEISRLLFLQSNPSAEDLVMADLSAIFALADALAFSKKFKCAGQISHLGRKYNVFELASRRIKT